MSWYLDEEEGEREEEEEEREEEEEGRRCVYCTVYKCICGLYFLFYI